MKILITGAAGFLGLHLTKYFHQENHNLTLLDIADFDPHEYPNSSQDSDNLHYIKGDIRDHAVMEPLIRDADILIHAAAALPLSANTEIFDTNVNGTKLLLEYASRRSVTHFIYISSTAVYGIPNVHPIVETAPLVGVGPYGESKIRAEQACREYRAKGLLVTILRPKTFVGTHRLGVFEILFDWIKDGKRIPVVGSGQNIYQLLDVDDLVMAIAQIISTENKSELNTEFNIGAGEYGSVKADLQKLFDFAQSGSRVLPTPAFPVKKVLWLFEQLKISPLYKWIYETADKDSFVSIDKLVKATGYEPRFSNAQALIKSYQWYLDNYKNVKARPAGVNHTSGWKQGVLGLVKKFL